MEQGLFARHIRNIKERENSKQEIITSIMNITGVLLNESEIQISKKKVSISTSSVKKTAVLQKGGKEALESLGYILQN